MDGPRIAKKKSVRLEPWNTIPFKHLPRFPGVYRIDNIFTGDFYIGASQNIRHRIYDHCIVLRGRLGHAPLLQKSYEIHGAMAFRASVVELTDKSCLREREKHHIAMLNPTLNRYLYDHEKREADRRDGLSISYWVGRGVSVFDAVMLRRRQKATRKRPNRQKQAVR